MGMQYVNVGSTANDHTGDTWRDAFIKINSSLAYLLSIIPPQQVVVYQSNPGDPGENRIFADASSVQQNILLGNANDEAAQRTVVVKADASANLVHITTSCSFGADTASYDLSGQGESIVFTPDPGTNKWFRE